MAEYLSPAVYIEEPPSGIKPIQASGTSVAAFVGHAQRGPLGEATALTNYGQFVTTFGNPIDDGYLAFAVKAFFEEGGSSCYVVRTAHYTAPGVSAATAARRTFQNAGPGAIDVLAVQASSPGTWGNDIAVEIAHPTADLFSLLVFRAGALVETLDRLSMNPLSRDYAPVSVEARSSTIRVRDVVPAASGLSAAARRPAVTAPAVVLTPGDDGLVSLTTADYVGDEASGTGLHALDAIDDVNLVAVPDAVDRAVHVQGMAYCERRMDCFYVADVDEMAVTTLEVLGYKRAQGLYAGGNALNSRYGALYAPWIDVLDPRSGAPIRIPPSGAVLGRFARTDATRGVHKAPAGITDGRLATAVGLAAEYGRADQDRLNPLGINVIRRLPGVGHAIWGARTTSSDPEWRYLNVRRLFLFIESSIRRSTNWTVFEPNDTALWKSLVRNVSAFLRIQWLAAALTGTTEEEAFFVKCDEENNPRESVLAGRVITDIGIAPSKPAEFVVFRIAQWEGGSDVAE